MAMGKRGPRTPSIRAVLLINLLPTLVFAVVITVSSAAVVWWIGTRGDALAALQERGALSAEAIRGSLDQMSWTWLGALAVFLTATGAGLWATRRAYRRLVARLESVASYADSITRGAPLKAPVALTDDALGVLEGSLVELGRAVCARERALRDQSAQRAFEGQLVTAFKMAPDEERSLDVVRRGLDATAPGLVAELLLADSSQAHLRRATASPAVAGTPTALCGVETPSACPASGGGHRLTFEDSGALDACHHLHVGSGTPCAAACFPVAVAGRTVGVLHCRFDAGALPSELVLGRLACVAQETGTRLGMLRALSSSELAAATDPLTGLLNRRSLDVQYGRATRTGSAVSLIMADLDHFKRLNDTFGHEAGDRALRVFAQCLTAAVRGGDIVARFGGEEFVIVLPGAPPDAILRVIGAIRRELKTRIGGGDLPSFTSSFGAVEGGPGTPLEELLRGADAALYEAKQAGRNRTVVQGHGVVEQGAAEDEPAAARIVV
ncbi:MAG: hypothetical protein CVU56_11265 [Deltaproteobacteria bacterium HGW-Deltaproteobacteria-14]|jgi:diguanylate cyclase (GGDEF)-like protein|nr:MAG: hypothetical protein CVU56_11265 [Deltaproteobacteria bacterium HGW-Deltaproteobacteria-14]